MPRYRLKINDTTVLNGPPLAVAEGDGVVDLIDFRRGYDGPAELRFRVYGDPGTPRFGADARVVLYRDDVLVFEGLTSLPRRSWSTDRYPHCEYTAFDYSNLLRRGTVLDENDNQSIALAGNTVGAIVTSLLELAGGQLTAERVGLEAEVNYRGGADALPAFPVTLQGQSFDEALRKIAAAAPGVALVMLPGFEEGESRYTFVNLYGSSPYQLLIDATRVPSLAIQQSIDDRCGAVRVLQGITQGETEFDLDQEVELTPDWTEDEENEWTWDDFFTRDKDGAPRSLAHVYRRFTYADPDDEITEATIPVGMTEVEPNELDPEDGIWQRNEVVELNTSEKKVLLRWPSIRKLPNRKVYWFNKWDPGHAKPAATKMQYNASYTGQVPIVIEEQRLPGTGFGGRAYELAKQTCAFEKIITVPGGVTRAAYAQVAFRAFTEPLVNGSIPINEPLPADLWQLDRRINVATVGGHTTGFESMQAPLQSITVEFGGGESGSIEFNRDDTKILGEGNR